MAKDFYSALGVDKNASKADIKKAFRTKAKEHHPDKGGDEAKFKEINEAYETLSDDSKKSQYDQFGSTGGPGGMGGGFGGSSQGFDFSDMFSGGGGGGFEDVFGSFFGGQQGGGRQQAQKGSDLEVQFEITFEESLHGVTKKLDMTSYMECEKCHAKGGTGQKTCGTCKGQGSIAQRFQTPLGVMSQQATCPHCKGQGSEFESTCTTCDGQGRKEKRHTLEIEIPAGIDNGETLVMRGKGDAGPNGAKSGDLYIHVAVRGSRDFTRRGLDVLSTLEVPLVDALIGGDFEIKTVWGKGTLSVPENTSDGQLLRLREKGIKRGNQKGDQLVTLKYQMPKKISNKAKEKLEELRKVL